MRKIFYILLALYCCAFAGLKSDIDSMTCRITQRPGDSTSFIQTHIQGRTYFDSYGKSDYGIIDFNLWKIGVGYEKTAWLKYNGTNGIFYAPYFNSAKQANFYGLAVAHCTTSVVAVIDSAEIRTGMRLGGLIHQGPNLSSYGAVKSLLINPDIDSGGINTICQIAPVIRKHPTATSGSGNQITMAYLVPIIDSLIKAHDIYGLAISGAQYPVGSACTSMTAIYIARELNGNSNCHIAIGVDSTPPGNHSIYNVSPWPNYLNGKLGLKNTNPDWEFDLGGDIIKACKLGSILPMYFMSEAAQTIGFNLYYDTTLTDTYHWRFGGGATTSKFGAKITFDVTSALLNIGVSSNSGQHADTAFMNKNLEIDSMANINLPYYAYYKCNGLNLLSESYFGYSTSNLVTQIGDTIHGISLGCGLPLNPSGYFTERSIIIPNNVSMIAENRLHDGYKGLIRSGIGDTLYIGGNYLTNGLIKIDTLGTIIISNLGTGTVESTLGVLSTSSDVRLKNVSQYFNKGLSPILKIKPIKYRYNKMSNIDTTIVKAGFSAQDVKAAGLTEAVYSDKTGKLSLDIIPIVAALVNSVKTLQGEIDTIKINNKIMQKQIDSLKNVIKNK